jgi:hypothetical protein
MMKKLIIFLLMSFLLFACSNTVEESKSSVKKSEVINSKTTEDPKKIESSSAGTSEMDNNDTSKTEAVNNMSAVDNEFLEGVSDCHGYIPDSHNKFKEALRTENDQYIVERDLIIESIEIAESGLQCTQEKMTDVGGVTIFEDSLDAYTKTLSKMIFFKNELDLYLENEEMATLITAGDYGTEMLELYNEFGDVYIQEAKDVNLID